LRSTARTALVCSLLCLAATRAEARKKQPASLTAETPPLAIPAGTDIERWALIRIPVKGPIDIAGMEMRNLPSPTGPACVTFLTAHMHLRGKLFAVDFIDSDGQVKNGDPRPELENPYVPGRFHLFTSRIYDDPAELHFDPPRYVTPGQRFHYACWHDNGVVAPPKLACVGSEGYMPGQSAADTALGRGSGPGTPCHQEGPNQTECAALGPAARCVRANLVFGPLRRRRHVHPSGRVLRS
jgi:hypothetical protein